MKRLLILDFYRALAIVLVILYHFYTLFPASRAFLGNFYGVPYGYLGIDIFFVLSGFLLTYTILQEREKGTFALKTYYKKRIARIVPAYYFALLIALLLTPVYMGSFMGVANIASHFLFLHNLVRDFHGAILEVGWTLGVEMQFYVLVPFLVLLFYKKRKNVFGVLIGAIGLAWIYKYLLITQFFPKWDFWNQFIYSTQLIGRIDQFAFGMTACCLYLWMEKKGMGEKIKEQRVVKGMWLVSVIAFFLILAQHMKVSPHYWNTPVAIIAEPTLFGLVIAGGLLCALFLQGWMKKILTHHIFVLIARYSYGLYLWHLMVMHQLQILPLTWPILFLYTVILSTILAVISYEFIEKPFLARVRSTEKQVNTLP